MNPTIQVYPQLHKFVELEIPSTKSSTDFLELGSAKQGLSVFDCEISPAYLSYSQSVACLYNSFPVIPHLFCILLLDIFSQFHFFFPLKFCFDVASTCFKSCFLLYLHVSNLVLSCICSLFFGCCRSFTCSIVSVGC